MRRLGWQQWVVLFLFLSALVVAGFFGVRAVRRAAYWRAHRDVPVRAWMSVPYVAHSYRVPPHVLYEAVGVRPVPPPDRRTLREIAHEQKRPVEEVITEVEDAITRARVFGPPPKRANEGGAPP